MHGARALLRQALLCCFLLVGGCYGHDHFRRPLVPGSSVKPKKEPNQSFQTCSVYILDIAKDLGLTLPPCDLNKNFVSRRGLIFGAESKHLGESDIGMHYASQHAGPYWLQKALRHAGVVTEDMMEADLVLVDDYCYHLAEISVEHGGRDFGFVNVREVLKAAYWEISRLPRFAKADGKDFAFFFPHPNSGGDDYYRCQVFEKSLMITIEKMGQWGCESQVAKSSLLLAPYSSTNMITGVDDYSHEKDILALLLGACGDFGGKLIRQMLIKDLGEELSRRDIEHKLKCTDEEPYLHQANRFLMQRAVFCLIPTGDSPSSRRLTEIILTGCIPVFLGPYWHTMPLADYVAYRDLGIFIFVEELAEHMRSQGRGVLDTSQALSEDEKTWWNAEQFPDADIHDLFEPTQQITDIADILLGKSDAEVRRLQQAVLKNQHFFMYKHHTATDEPLPIIPDAILDTMCRRSKNSTRYAST